MDYSHDTYAEQMNELWCERTQRGHRAIELHPDLGPDKLDLETAATDIIADVLHALADAGLADGNGDYADAILARALRTYQGDAEDVARQF